MRSLPRSRRLQGNARYKPLSGADVQKKSDAELTDAIAKGKGKMQPFAGKLTDDQIKSLVAYVRTLKK